MPRARGRRHIRRTRRISLPSLPCLLVNRVALIQRPMPTNAIRAPPQRGCGELPNSISGISDALRAFEGDSEAMKIKDVMTTAVRTIHPDASLKEAARLMTELQVSGVPVVTAG